MEQPPVDAAPTATPARRLRVLIADDNEEFLEVLGRLLRSDPHLDVIETVRSGDAAIERAAALQPDIMLISLRIPVLTGFEVAKRVKAQPRAPLVVLMTIDDLAEYREAARLISADGFIAKPTAGTSMLPLLYQLCHLDPAEQE